MKKDDKPFLNRSQNRALSQKFASIVRETLQQKLDPVDVKFFVLYYIF
jgi:hypothetical protein